MVSVFRTVISAAILVALVADSVVLAATASLPLGAVLAIPNPNLRTVEIVLDSANGVEAALFRIGYNRSIAVATQVRKTALTNPCAIEINTANPNNEVQISMACTNPLNGGGTMFEIDFAGVNPGLSNLTFLECGLNEGNPTCQVSNGSLRVTTCALDVDSSGAAAANTDGVYIFRALSALQIVVPTAFRQLIPGIPLDPVILDNVDALGSLLNVDDRGGTQANTDGVYIFRSLPPALQTIVPPLFRQIDPTIPSDEVIGANVEALCP
jgi:hypothetical protein